MEEVKRIEIKVDKQPQNKVIAKEYVENNYISKQKIIDKIDEINQEYLQFLNKEGVSLEVSNINGQRNDAMNTVLRELLEDK